MKEIKIVQMYPFIEDLHTIHKSLVTNPPKRYKFVGYRTSNLYKLRKKVSKSKIIRFLYHLFFRIFKTNKINEATTKSSTMKGVDLIFGGISPNHQIPNVVYIFDHPACLEGNNYHLFLKEKDKYLKIFSRDNLKKIVCTNESHIPFLKKHFPKEITNKIELVRLGVKERPKKKFREDKKLRLLFMGSINNPQDFYIKGGLYVVELAKKLKDRKDIEIIIRCKMPKKIKIECEGIKNLRVIDKEVNYKGIINIYKNSDVMIMPGHNYSVTSFLEGMSFGLPIIALNTFAVKDFIKNGFNGFIVEKSPKIKGYNNPAYPTFIRTDEFMREVINNRDSKVIERLTGVIDRLVKDKSKLKKMSRNCQKEIHEKYSIERRNKDLKKVFDLSLKE